jgi:DNA mismatch repair protein MutS2
VKPGALLDAPGAAALEFAWLVQALSPASEYGRRVFEALLPFPPGCEREAQARAEGIASLANAAGGERLDAVRDVLRNAPDAAGAIARASMGEVLADAQLFEVHRLCDQVARVDALLYDAGASRISNDDVQAAAAALEPGRSGAFGFYLADAFDAALAAARAELGRTQAEYDAARARLSSAVAAALGRDDLGGEEFIVMRGGGALPPRVRVLREAPTYVLCALEYDESTLEALARRESAATAVAECEHGVRAALSRTIAQRAGALDGAMRALGEIDVAVAAARFTLSYDCATARIVPSPELTFGGGRFLPLADELAAEGRRFAPIDVSLRDVAVLTGPNMGGKSVTLRTCGFVALCAAFGVPVPARAARIALFEEISWLGIGSGEETPGGLLSSFAREVVRLRDVLARGAARQLVLVDEFARTTTPHEGKALLVALLERLRGSGACGLAATHLAGVAAEAGARHFAVRGLRGIPQRPAATDLREALAVLAESMDYTIAEVSDGQEGSRADAIALASLLGLDGDLIAAAYRALR